MALLATPTAHAGVTPGAELPPACASLLFTDVVATLVDDVVIGGNRPERIYGLTGNDRLLGSRTRASCLFGGRGDDTLGLGDGGGIAMGERGNDLVTGSWRDDALSGGDGDDTLMGLAGADVLRGTKGTDFLDGGPGDDVVDAYDGRPELVNCGAGEADIAIADGADVLLGCETTRVEGSYLRVKKVARKGPGAARMRWTVPETAGEGEWRVILLNCDGTLREAARLPAVRKGQRTSIGLVPPPGGWCVADQTGAIVRARPCPTGRTCVAEPPPVPLAYLRF
jgi:hypothetical protein